MTNLPLPNLSRSILILSAFRIGLPAASPAYFWFMKTFFASKVAIIALIFLFLTLLHYFTILPVPLITDAFDQSIAMRDINSLASRFLKYFEGTFPNSTVDSHRYSGTCWLVCSMNCSKGVLLFKVSNSP
jgi:hypothetical protein